MALLACALREAADHGGPSGGIFLKSLWEKMINQQV